MPRPRPTPVRGLLAAAVALTAALAGAPAGTPAAAQAPSPAPAGPGLDGPAVPVWPGLVRHDLAFDLPDGRPSLANVMVFGADDDDLELRPVLAGDEVAGLETVVSTGDRLLDGGGIAGVNGGFWLSNPLGDPNSYLALDGALVSDSETQGAGPRGTAAFTASGGLLMDRLDSVTTVTSAALRGPLDVSGVNRYASFAPPYPDSAQPVYVYTPAFGDTVDLRPVTPPDPSADPTTDRGPLPLRAVVVDGLIPRADGTAEGIVAAVATEPGTVEVPPNGSVLVGHGQAASDLGVLAPGSVVAVGTELRPIGGGDEWRDVVQGLAAGPLIVADGVPTDPGDWEDEGFAPQVHSDVRAPRSALGFTADRRVLLATVDGRQPGVAAGMTIAELADFMVGLGAVDALSLDGGGSTQLVNDGLLVNRACCDQPLRPVATGLFVFHDYEYVATERLAGDRREATAAVVADAGWPDGAEEVLLAAAGSFPDALAGGPLAAAVDGPLLLTGADGLSEATAGALADLDPETVTVLGGESAVGDAVRGQLEEEGYGVRRIAGRERTATAAAIAAVLEDEAGPAEVAFLASGADFPDALGAAAPAGLLGAPVLLSGTAELPESTTARLAGTGVEEVVIVGGASAVGESVDDDLADLDVAVTRLAGEDRFATARTVNEWAAERLDCAEGAEPCLDPDGLLVARGDAFPDALAGGPLAARRRQLLTILPSVDIEANPSASSYLAGRAADLDRVTILGGPVGLSSYQQWQLDQLARG